ncbi:MAG: hypothetical protein PVH41_09270, partial [Anaerolineae bacterium]
KQKPTLKQVGFASSTLGEILICSLLIRDPNPAPGPLARGMPPKVAHCKGQLRWPACSIPPTVQ